VAFFAIGTSGVLLIMKKLSDAEKRTGNVMMEFLKTMREGRFPVASMWRQRQRCLVVWRL
jgi:hypothetical protein